ncbi:MAG: hypothetical protein BHW65_09555 [Verrucomicrobia bacterium CAG:312_58_20]|nr:MAG: hypothetical protein BHW65_09555 [Verrucomicrobia bacterium CAG:312_58_20]
MSSCSKMRPYNALMKIQMRAHKKFPSLGAKSRSGSVSRQIRLTPASKGRGIFWGENPKYPLQLRAGFSRSRRRGHNCFFCARAGGAPRKFPFEMRRGMA